MQLRHSIDDAIAKEILSAKPVVLPMTMTGTLQLIPHNKIEGMRVIFNNPTTILIVNGKKYISKAHDEEFDEEPGVQEMCSSTSWTVPDSSISHLPNSLIACVISFSEIDNFLQAPAVSRR